MASNILDAINKYGEGITDIPDHALKDFYNITTAFSYDFKKELERRGIEIAS